MVRDRYPDFIVIGAAKSGTTSLAAMLEHHPDVFITTPKEPHYFSFGWERRRQEYEDLFKDRAESFKGEASTTYSQGLFGDAVPERIHETIPEVRLIYMLRDPVERIRSQYIHWIDRGREHRDIEEAVRGDPRYIEHTRYGRQLSAYLRFFPRSQILVLANEWLREGPETLIRQTLEFIGADADRLSQIPDTQMNRSVDKRRSSPAMGSVRMWARRRGLLRFLPLRGRMLIHRYLSRPLDHEGTRISPDLASFIWDELESDQALLRTLVEPSFPIWGPEQSSAR